MACKVADTTRRFRIPGIRSFSGLAPLLPLIGSCSVLWLTAFCAVPGYAQILSPSPSSQTASPGQTFTVSLSLMSQGAAIAGTQFDLEWDAGLTVQVIAGDQVRSANKNLFTGSLSSRSIRCLIVGINQTTLADGELLQLIISSKATASGSAQIRIVNTVAAAPDSSAIPLGAAPVSVQLQGTGNSILSFPSSAILNAASWLPGPISPGEVISLVGGLGSESTVLIDGVAAPILYAGANQVNAIVPFDLDLTSAATIQILSPGQTFARVTTMATAVSPAIFTLAGSGFGPGAILNQDFSVNSFEHPAAPGSVIMIYATGLGLVSPAASDGQLAFRASRTTLPVTASIAGLPADVLYAGAAPGIVYGVMQINLFIPRGVTSNLAAAIALTIDGVTTPNGPTVAIQAE